jgi:hypothetical protein
MAELPVSRYRRSMRTNFKTAHGNGSNCIGERRMAHPGPPPARRPGRHAGAPAGSDRRRGRAARALSRPLRHRFQQLHAHGAGPRAAAAPAGPARATRAHRAGRRTGGAAAGAAAPRRARAADRQPGAAALCACRRLRPGAGECRLRAACAGHALQPRAARARRQRTAARRQADGDQRRRHAPRSARPRGARDRRAARGRGRRERRAALARDRQARAAAVRGRIAPPGRGAETTVVIGDNPLTDAEGAARLGMACLLVGQAPGAVAPTVAGLFQALRPVAFARRSRLSTS